MRQGFRAGEREEAVADAEAGVVARAAANDDG